MSSDKREIANTNPERKGLQISGFVLGLTSVVFCWTVFLTVIPAIVGIFLSAFGVKRKNLRGLSVSGLVLSIVGLLISAFLIMVLAVTAASVPADRKACQELSAQVASFDEARKYLTVDLLAQSLSGYANPESVQREANVLGGLVPEFDSVEGSQSFNAVREQFTKANLKYFQEIEAFAARDYQGLGDLEFAIPTYNEAVAKMNSYCSSQ